MSAKENKELVRRAGKELSEIGGDVAKARAWCRKYYAPTYVYHSLSGGDLNREQAEQYVIAMVTAFPDAYVENDDLVAEGDKVVARYTMRATHKGSFHGIPATGKHVTLKGMEMRRIVGGKSVENWDLMDSLGLMTQLGAIPAPKK